MSTFTEAASSARVPVIADVFASSRVRTALMVLGGALFTALMAQIVIPMTPVPMTGQTLAVVLVGAALGWKRGMAALTLYMVLGFFLPFFADASSGAEKVTEIGSIAGATGGYIIGFIFAAGAVGWLAEHGSDRKFVTAFLSFVVGSADHLRLRPGRPEDGRTGAGRGRLHEQRQLGHGDPRRLHRLHHRRPGQGRCRCPSDADRLEDPRGPEESGRLTRSPSIGLPDRVDRRGRPHSGRPTQ